MLTRTQREDPDVPPIFLLSEKMHNKNELLIGRGTDSDILLESLRCPLLISRCHALMSRRGGKLLLQDTQSLNGTFVNGVRVDRAERRVLGEGDIISFGGPQVVRQAGKESDETNPFCFRLTRLRLLLDSPCLPAPLAATEAQEVVDLTGSDSGGFATKSPAEKSFVDLDDWPSEDEEYKAKRLRPDTQHSELPPDKDNNTSKDVAGPSSNSILKALEGQFECMICREFMVATHSLVPCGHMFCGDCLGEWLFKKISCPSCRANATAPPVPSLSIDNMLEEVVVPLLDCEARKERDTKKAAWSKKAAQINQALAQRFNQGGRGGHGPHPAVHDFLSLPFAGQLVPMTTFSPEFLMGRMPTARATTRIRRTGGPSGRNQGTSTNDPLAAAPAPGFSFVMTASRGGRRRCAHCSSNLGHSELVIQKARAPGGLVYLYHIRCANSIVGFRPAWIGTNGTLSGSHALNANDRAMLQTMFQ